MEAFPDAAEDLLPAWERLCGIEVGADESLQARRGSVVKQLNELGGLSREYFIRLAESMGHTIEIEEFRPFMAGWGETGVDELNIEEAVFCWLAKGVSQEGIFFRAGESAAGESLSYPSSSLEGLFENLKPAHTWVGFEYSY